MGTALKQSHENEKRVEAYLKKRVRQAGGRTYKWVSPGTAGVPDRIVVLPEERTMFVELKGVWFIELKGTEGVPTELQKKRIRELEALGCNVTILGSCSDVDTFLRCLDSRYSMEIFIKHQSEKYGISEDEHHEV